MNTPTVKHQWIQTKDRMPKMGQKVLVYLWMDKAVNQAWWNGENYILAAANEEGIVAVYEVKPEAISHWQLMPDMPVESNDNDVEQWEDKLNGTMH